MRASHRPDVALALLGPAARLSRRPRRHQRLPRPIDARTSGPLTARKAGHRLAVGDAGPPAAARRPPRQRPARRARAGRHPPGGDGLGAPVDDAKIVRTGTMELQVADVPKALAAARDGIRAIGGYIGASQTQNGVTSRSPRSPIGSRSPDGRKRSTPGGLNGLTTKVVSQQTNAVEVTGQLVDLEARIRNLKASETALRGSRPTRSRCPTCSRSRRG